MICLLSQTGCTIRYMAFLGTLTSSYRAERTSRPRRTRRPLLTLAAQALGRAAARVAPRLVALRTALLSLAGFGLVDVGVWQWNHIIGLVAAGASLLVLEALSGRDGGAG